MRSHPKVQSVFSLSARADMIHYFDKLASLKATLVRNYDSLTH